MSRFEEYVERITRDLDLSREMIKRVQQEAANHLEDEKAALVKSGLSAEEAETEALRRFGDETALSDLISRSLEAARRKYRRTRALRRLCLFLILPCVVLVIGSVWASFIDEIDSVGYMPFSLFVATFFLSLGIVVWIGAVLVGRLTGCRPVAIALAAFVVVVAFLLAPIIFHYTGLETAFGQVTSDMSTAEIAKGRFVMWLCMCWIPTALAGIGAIWLRKDRLNLYLVVASFGTGFVSAALGWASLALGYNWLRPFKWPKSVGEGLWFIVGGALVLALARGFDIRLPRRKPRRTPDAPKTAST